MEQKKKEESIQQTDQNHKLTSNDIRQISKVNTEEVFKDVLKLIEKHAGVNQNIDVFGPPEHTDNGFFLIFIKRDEKMQNQRILITTFGQNMNLEDLAGSLTNIIQQTIENSNKKVYYS